MDGYAWKYEVKKNYIKLISATKKIKKKPINNRLKQYLILITKKEITTKIYV